MQVWHLIDGFDGKAEAIGLVTDGELKGCVNVSFLSVSANVQVESPGSLVGQAVDHPGVAVEVEDNRLVFREQADPLLVVQSVRVLSRADELKEVNNVDDADLELGEVSQKEIDGSQHLVCADITARRHDDVGLLASVGTELWPGADSLGAVGDGLIHGKVLQVLLLVGYDRIDVVGGGQAMIHDRKKTVAIWGEIDTDHLGALVRKNIQETRILMSEAIVILPPNNARQ